MKSTAALFTLGLMLGASGSALAAATPEEAQRLTALFQSYLGSDPGVVSVTPKGDSYAARIDVAPLFAKVKDPSVSLSLSPLEWTITDEGGGKWKVDQSQPLSFAFGVTGQAETIGTIASVTSNAVFDEALGTFASATAEMKDIRGEQKVTDKGLQTHVTFALESMSMKTAMQGTPESADGTTRYAYAGFKETISVPAAADGSSPAMDITFASPSGSQDGTVKGLRTRAITELMTWFVAHRSKEAMIADQATLKERLRAALPLFDSLAGTNVMNDVTIGSMMGQFGVKQLQFGAEMNGIGADGRLRQSFSVSGLQMPAELLPPWAAGMVPEKFNVDVSVADFNLAVPAGIILDRLDLSKPEPIPNDLDAALLQALLPKGAVTVTLGQSQILAKLFDVTADGIMTAGPIAMPVGQATVKMKGMDETMAAMQAGPPDIQQMGPLLLLMKGLGKQEADGTLSWKIESTPAGAITVNGADMSKMLGGQQ